MSAVAHVRLLPEPIDVGGSLDDLGPLTPELALVDPELARAARALLPDRPAVKTSLSAAPIPASSVTVTEAVEQTPGVTGSGIDAPLATAAQAFVFRHFAAGILVGFLVAGFAVEAYVLLEPFRSRSTSELVASTPAVEAPTPTRQPTVGSPATRPPPVVTTPGAVAPPRPAAILAWPAKPGAAAYRVTLLRKSVRIFERTTRSTRLPLPLRWRYGGRPRRLAPGTYRWIVNPLRRVGSTWQPGAPIVDATYVVAPTPS